MTSSTDIPTEPVCPERMCRRWKRQRVQQVLAERVVRGNHRGKGYRNYHKQQEGGGDDPKPDGTAVRDPLLPSVPTLSEFLKANGIVPTATRLAAYDAAASAARTCFVATLPDLLRPSALAEWRRGAGIVDDSLSVASVSDPQDVRLLTNNAAATHLAAVLAGAPAIPLINRLVQQRSAARLG